ncbi:hypothetical protein RHGRI_034291 [Rhododendron griersonianum]|uniref:Uncharacterized protein n=1 Tax=Rhododendron griersonianum TaxID=479676 RepID=A0AAV6I4K3_9ERIC|nr:hypothetical protein RHGRI_034291 [Rhododendron griersonianum]
MCCSYISLICCLLISSLQGLKLQGCLNSTTCLSKKPKVTTVLRGTSASIYLDNAAYRGFIYRKFNISPVDMESAAVALICLQQSYLSSLLGLSLTWPAAFLPSPTRLPLLLLSPPITPLPLWWSSSTT